MSTTTAVAPAETPIALRRVQYRDGGRVRSLLVSAETAAEIERYDRWVRRRSDKFRKHHRTGVESLNKVADPISILGLLNSELEPATDRLGVKVVGKPGAWEGPYVRVDRWIGERGPWSGRRFGVLKAVVCPGAENRKDRQLVFDETVETCPLCEGVDLGGTLDGEVISVVCCAWCGRSNVEYRFH